VGITQAWSSGSVAATTLDRGVFLALVVVGTFLLVLEQRPYPVTEEWFVWIGAKCVIPERPH
jgi:hypothetical protein